MINKYYSLALVLLSVVVTAQTDSIAYKKRVLESAEVDFLMSYYKQDGAHSAVSGGMGDEYLTDFATNIVVSVPLNDDDVLTVDTGISAYSSASSSNINPFNASGASGGGGGYGYGGSSTSPTGTPWQASSGASAKDVLASANFAYSHSSDNRNFIWNANVYVSNEYDYTSIGFGGGISKLFNHKNSEVSLKATAYLDEWRPIYPTELSEYSKYGSNFQSYGYFSGVTVYDQNGIATNSYLPNLFSVWDSAKRNSYAGSVSFSQVINKKLQGSIFVDYVLQQGKLSTPYHRVYFSDKSNYYIGNTSYIHVYESTSNTGVYRLADAIENLPDTRVKLPVGMRLNYYVNEKWVVRSYYRYYWDDWGITAHTANIELPYKISDAFTLYPMYRYYTQTASEYFAPFEKHVSTEKYYTSDFDLSAFTAHQYGFGFNYTDIFSRFSIWKFGMKNLEFRFNHYTRSDGLKANIGSLGLKFVMK